MTSTAIPSLLVGMAGLDLLPQTRLKVACSLMAAERLILRPAQWGEGPCALLVADEASPHGQEAIADASASSTPVIRLAESARPTPLGQVLGRKATVRDFVDALRAGLSGRTAGEWAAEAEPELPPFLESIRLDKRGKGRRLLENGLVRVIVDSGAGQVHMLRRLPLLELLQRALRTDWSVTGIDDDAWRTGYSNDIISTHSIEALWWRIAPTLPEELLGPEASVLQMLQWPDLDPGTVDAGWMLPMACLQMRGWEASQLAEATQSHVKDAKKIMAAVRYAGLGGRPDAEVVLAAPGRSSASGAMALFKMAKRFGLKLFGVAHA